MITFLILLALLFVIVVGVELVTRRFILPLEVSRKATHILTGVIVALSAYYVTQPYLIALALMFIAVIAISRKRSIFRSIHDSNRSGVGELWYPIGILLAAILFPQPTVFMYAILILSVSDGLAGVIGKQFGTRTIKGLTTTKTYVGTGVFFISAALLSLLVLPLPIALAAAVILSLIELISVRGLDNLFLPVAAGFIAVLCEALR